MNELAKTYEASQHEDAIYHAWEASGFFNPDNLSRAKEPFSIAIPPPNATGTLHMGHTMFLTLQDLMTRFARMRGKKALWLPGTDHASIATQNKVEKLLAKEGKTRHDMSRDEFVGRIDDYVAQSRSTIRNQIRKMGSSCDWSRERYTLDVGLSHAVTEMFVRMYGDGLIYRGNRIVNWCPRCKSTLADDEVKYRPEKTPFYYFKYGPVVIGTARPETKFLDKTIVVHPDDGRYKELVGKEFDVEWIEGPIRAHVIADAIADKEFGTGAMTITPGHSFEDFELAGKYHLPVEKIIDENGNLTEHAGSFALRNARDSRAAIVKKLQEKNLVDHVDENYEHNLSVCYRCDTPVEPLPSLQWFIAVNKKIEKRGKSLKELASEAVSSGRITILPKRFDKIYFSWMNGLRDWCISRQIVFGHRMPVYYCEKEQGGCGEVIVSGEPPTECAKCKHTNVRHDEDTLDTWFSAALWTFSTLGWPENVEDKNGKIKKKGDLATFHPTTVMETGYDIIFFWVARMIIMSEYALHEEPFKTVYLHGLVLDENRKKMSKSREETQIDPLDMIPQYGADALRMSMLVGVTPGNDLFISKEKIAGYRNFVNKLWNVSRFILQFSHDESEKKHPLTLADRWIFSRLASTISRITNHIEAFQFSRAAEELRRFTWDEVADWYLEVAKIEKNKRQHLLRMLEHLLALWHPFTPFVTEVVYQHMRKTTHPHFISLMIHSWPSADKKMIDEKSERAFSIVQEMIRQIRNARQEHAIPPSQKIQCWFQTKNSETLIADNAEIVMRLGRIDMLKKLESDEKPHNAVFLKISDDLDVYLPLGMKPREEERGFIEKEIAMLGGLIQDINQRLTNNEFLTGAPKHILEAETKKRNDYLGKIEKLEEQLKKISNS
ncbi:valine--tRNA ligase [Candidatus Uhrbacteria bacterium]|nr:valine--tRNA ligase [Candidatus Uhrbacteria bacterium]